MKNNSSKIQPSKQSEEDADFELTEMNFIESKIFEHSSFDNFSNEDF